ncbi:MAG: M28 family peptidase [Planctomycetota bacterium]|nr:M28 family peptidase [Planctomycetota bacterium]
MNDAQRASFEQRVRALADFGHRGSTTVQEQRAADYLCEQLRLIGLEPQRELFQGSSSFGGRILIHVIVAAAGGVLFWLHPLLAIAIDAAVLASMWAENRTCGIWLSRPIVRYESANVFAWIRTPSPRLRVIASGHYDTQRTGFMWILGKYLIPLFWWLPSFLKPPLLPAGLIICGQAVLSALVFANGMTDTLSIANGVVLVLYTVAILLVGEWSIGAFVPGAADNASGAAAALALAEDWLTNPIDDVEFVVLLPGCEESGLLGAAAWADQHRAELNSVPTVFVNFDNLGVGPVKFFKAETPLFGWPVAYPPEMIQTTSQVATAFGLEDNRPHTMPGPTDGLAFLVRGLPGMTIVSFREHGYMPWYHLPGDTAEHLDFDAAWRGVLFGSRLLRTFAQSNAESGQM